MAEKPLQSTEWVRLDPSEQRRQHMTAADTDGSLDWDKTTRLAWRPAWAIRSRRGALRPFLAMLRSLWN